VHKRNGTYVKGQVSPSPTEFGKQDCCHTIQEIYALSLDHPDSTPVTKSYPRFAL
jgi:hypothetical protein